MEGTGQLHAPVVLQPGKQPRYPLYRRLGGSQSRSGRSGEEKISYPYQESNPESSVVQSVA
jgi:hypothetical protein